MVLQEFQQRYCPEQKLVRFQPGLDVVLLSVSFTNSGMRFAFISSKVQIRSARATQTLISNRLLCQIILEQTRKVSCPLLTRCARIVERQTTENAKLLYPSLWLKRVESEIPVLYAATMWRTGLNKPWFDFNSVQLILWPYVINEYCSYSPRLTQFRAENLEDNFGISYSMY